MQLWFSEKVSCQIKQNFIAYFSFEHVFKILLRSYERSHFYSERSFKLVSKLLELFKIKCCRMKKDSVMQILFFLPRNNVLACVREEFFFSWRAGNRWLIRKAVEELVTLLTFAFSLKGFISRGSLKYFCCVFSIPLRFPILGREGGDVCSLYYIFILLIILIWNSFKVSGFCSCFNPHY